MDLKNKALEYIENLCYVYEDGNKEDLKNTQKIIEQIYTYAHCVQENHSCYASHSDWRDELKAQSWEI